MSNPLAAFVLDLIAAFSQADHMRRQRADLVEQLARQKAFPWPRVDGMPLDHRRELAAVLSRLGYGIPAAQLDPGNVPPWAQVPYQEAGTIGAVPGFSPREVMRQAEEEEKLRRWFFDQMAKHKPDFERFFAAMDLAREGGLFGEDPPAPAPATAGPPAPAPSAPAAGVVSPSECVIKDAVSAEVWADLARRFPGMTGPNSVIVRRKDLSEKEWSDLQASMAAWRKEARGSSSLLLSRPMFSEEEWEKLCKRFPPALEDGPIMMTIDQVTPSEWEKMRIAVLTWQAKTGGLRLDGGAGSGVEWSGGAL